MLKKILIPVGILVIAVISAKGLIALKSEPPKKPNVKPSPLVEIQRIEKSSLQFSVRSHGTVVAKRSIDLVSEVSGRVLWVSPKFVQGEMVNAGEVLLKTDPVDYQVALAEAKAKLADEILDLAEENARVNQAAEDWAVISKEKAGDLTLRKPQLAKAKASVIAAREKLRQAGKNLERTIIRAPFNAVIDSKSADLGQFISKGKNVAQLLGTDIAEIRLPITASELNFVRPLLVDENNLPKVRFTSNFVNNGHYWEGSIVRMEARMDPDTRVFYLTAEVQDPYGLVSNKTPLNVGMFVEAIIEGMQVEDVVRISRGSLHDAGYVYVLDQDKQLQRREVEMIRSERESVIVGTGLQQGDLLVLTRLELMVEGMPVSLAGDKKEDGIDIQSDSIVNNEAIASDVSNTDKTSNSEPLMKVEN